MSRLEKKITVRAAVAFIAIVVIDSLLDPSWVPFLTSKAKYNISKAMESFGDEIEGIREFIPFNWITAIKLILVVLWVVIFECACRLILLGMEKHGKKAGKMRSVTINHMLQDILSKVAFFIGVIWALGVLGVSPTILFAGTSILALIVGGSSERLIEDGISSFFILFDREYDIGDIIQFNGYRGKVINIGLRTTSIQDKGGNVRIVNNSDIRDVINCSRNRAYAINDITVPVSVKE